MRCHQKMLSSFVFCSFSISSPFSPSFVSFPSSPSSSFASFLLPRRCPRRYQLLLQHEYRWKLITFDLEKRNGWVSLTECKFARFLDDLANVPTILIHYFHKLCFVQNVDWNNHNCRLFYNRNQCKYKNNCMKLNYMLNSLWNFKRASPFYNAASSEIHYKSNINKHLPRKCLNNF